MLGLEREHGTHEGHLRSAALEIWAKQLRRHDFVQWPGPSRSNNPRSIRHFIQDPATGAIAYSMDYSQDSSFPNSPWYVVTWARHRPEFKLMQTTLVFVSP